MNVKTIPTRRPPRARAAPVLPMHPQYPIAQAYRTDDARVHQQLLQTGALPVVAPEQALLLIESSGLCVLGRAETALALVAGRLRQRFGAALVADEPVVRYAEGNPMLEPYMVVLVHGPAQALAPVRRDFLARGGRIVRVTEGSSFVLEGEAPLAQLLGYHDHVWDLLADGPGSHVATWLSRYVPVTGDGPAAA